MLICRRVVPLLHPQAVRVEVTAVRVGAAAEGVSWIFASVYVTEDTLWSELGGLPGGCERGRLVGCER